MLYQGCTTPALSFFIIFEETTHNMKKLTKLIGLSINDFDEIVNQVVNPKDKQIELRSARLIPALKTGDEMALTSIFLSTLRLVKEFRDVLFREFKIK